jgi:hypothetical protein
VNLGSVTRTATGVGEGFLYGVSQDGTAPPDQFVQPLGITALRSGGHGTPTGGWIADGYTYGTSTKAKVAEVIAQAKRFTAGSYHAPYQVLLSDIYGADGSQPSNTTWPCTGRNCANYVTFLDDVVGAIQASGVKVTYDIWNEPRLPATRIKTPGAVVGGLTRCVVRRGPRTSGWRPLAHWLADFPLMPERVEDTA